LNELKVGIEQAFDEVVSKILETPALEEVVIKKTPKAGVNLTNQASANSGGGGCGC